MNKQEVQEIVKPITPIILGVALSGLGTLMSFAYGSIEEIKRELVNHRVLLSKLISPDGNIMQSPTSAESKRSLRNEIHIVEKQVVELQTKIEYLENERSSK